MTKTLSTFLALFLFTPILVFSKPSGHWRQVFPEENGKIPRSRYNHYMCPIGDQQVLMLAGEGDGNPYYYNETWLYNYKTNIWTKILCDSMPDVYSWTSEPGNHLYKISKTRAIASCLNTPWIFDLDSMKWFTMPEEGGIYNATYIRENVIFSYYVGTKWDDKYPFEAKYAGSSVLCTMHPEEPFDSPDFLTFETVNDEWVTGQGPVAIYQHMDDMQKCFVLNNDSQNVVFIPVWGGLQAHSFMSMSQNTYNWLFLSEGKDTLPLATRRVFSSITNNLTVLLNAKSTYIIEYSRTENLMYTHKIDTLSIPSKNPSNISQIKDGIIMLFGGERYSVKLMAGISPMKPGFLN